ncbi:hypothetical protein Droror1_Dr00012159 [Drosera rotundifolia]
MEESEIGGGGGKHGDPFIDRSKVRILLCDNDTRSSTEVLELLCRCCYQVTSVRSARQVIDVLNAEGSEIDIILAEVDLPMKKGMKMLKYITRDKELQRIPVIMMSALDEVSIVVKCLRLGAADYLVKPLRTNELLNLWTHMWRRRRMLGLAEKNILNYEVDLMASDPSDSNTNSTTLFSDDTDEKSRKSMNPDTTLPTYQEDELSYPDVDRMHADSFEHQPDVLEISNHQTGQFTSCPKKSELKIGESSAFFSYTKSSLFKSKSKSTTTEKATSSLVVDERSKAWQDPMMNQVLRHEHGLAFEYNSQGDELPSSASFPDSTSMERSCTPSASFEHLQSKSSDEGLSKAHMHPRNGTQFDLAAGFAAHASYPYYMPPGVMNPSMMTHPYQNNNPQDLRNHGATEALPQFNTFPHCPPPHVPGMTPFPYYLMGMCLPPGQMPTANQWRSPGSSNTDETKLKKVDRREAALVKFRQKRKERCFDKKIRYVNRKKLAERRPRIRGQFVTKVNRIKVDLNGEPTADPDEDEEEEDDDDPTSRDSSPEDDAS